MSIERNERWEKILKQKYQNAVESVDIARLNMEDYWNPLIDEAIEEKDFDLALNYTRQFSDMVSASFALDRIRQAQKAV
jgi:hypothetical protein